MAWITTHKHGMFYHTTFWLLLWSATSRCLLVFSCLQKGSQAPSPVCWVRAVVFSVLQTFGPKLVGTLWNFVTLVMKFGSRPVMEKYYLLAHGEVHSKLYSHFIKASHSNCRVLLDWVPKQMVWSMRCSPLLGFSIRRLWWSLHGVEKPSMPSTPHTFLLLQTRSIPWFYFIQLRRMARAVCCILY